MDVTTLKKGTFANMKHQPVPIFSTHRFSKLMEDYVAEKQELSSLYSRPHKPESYSAQIAERSSVSVDRNTLVEVLHDQYSSLDIEKRYPRVFEHVEELKDSSTFTVVTGHQLCLFTGPLYFIYKIVNTIRLAEELSERENVKVVPVFWMASEDHDFEEINHMWYCDLKYQWNRTSGDGVGRLHTDGIDQVIDELERSVGKSKPVSEFIDLLRRCYRSGQTLSQATRELATELFADKGLIVLDADDARLKRQMVDIFSHELTNTESANVMSKTSEILSQEYFTQVTPRDINLFYLNNEQRYRLTFDGDEVMTVDGPYRWSKDEVKQELNSHPERFSPNVVLRPVYQEVILPNLAYIGGGGELAYWLQLKGVFDHYRVPFPILRLRNSAGFIRRKYVHKMDKLELSVSDISEKVFEQKRNHFRKELKLEKEMDLLKSQSDQLFTQMEELANRIDPSLIGTASAYNARQKHLIDNFEKKILRSQQRRESEITRMFDEVHGEAFPSGGLQERRDNYVTLLERFGDGVLDLLYDEMDPFAHDFSWFTE